MCIKTKLINVQNIQIVTIILILYCFHIYQGYCLCVWTHHSLGGGGHFCFSSHTFFPSITDKSIQISIAVIILGSGLFLHKY